MIIKIEDNSYQIRQYLEILGYKWVTGDNPTKFCPILKHNCFELNDNKIMFYGVEFEGMSFEEFKRQYPIKKEHIRSGMIVEYANEERRLVVEINGKLILISRDSFQPLEEYNEDLTIDSKELFINKVGFTKWAANLRGMLRDVNFVWERPNPVTEVTLDEIAKKFNIDVKQLKIKE